MAAHADCDAHPADQGLRAFYDQHNWTEVARAGGRMPARSAEADFEYGMALAHLGEFDGAREALLAGRQQCPSEKRFATELAGVAFQQKRYPEASAWMRSALKLDPGDAYANDFAGTVYFLMGNLDAALKYWNRAHKPWVAALRFDANLRVQRLLLDRSFTFSPAAVLERDQLGTTETRLEGLGIFPAFHIELSARPDGSFDADFHAMERNGFGSSRLQALVSTFAGATYETVYPSYFNLDREAINVESLLRWDKEKRRVWVSLSAPVRNLPQRRWELAADARNENWDVRSSSRGYAPSQGSLNLEREVLSGAVTGFTSGRLNWSAGGELSHRIFRGVADGPAFTASLLSPGFALKQTARVEDRVIDLPERRFTVTTEGRSELARLWSDPPRLFAKLQGSTLAHWQPQAEGDTYEVSQRLRGGGTFGAPPFDELFMLGMERDNDLWLRGQPGTRDGRKGSSPLGTDYLLANSDFYRRIYGNGLIRIQAGPLFDMGRMSAPAAGLAASRWLFNTGIEAKLSVLGTAIVLTWGRDLRTGTNAFYGTVAQ